MKKALIFGITGQDGSYLAELLLKKGYEVHGFIRRSATGNKKNITHILDQLNLHCGDLADSTSIYRTINNVKPDEIYNEADQDHVSWSYHSVEYSCDITGTAVARILEIINLIGKDIKFFQPLSSNMFGKAEETPQNEDTALRPQSPYAAAKILAYVMCKYYREVHGLHASTAIFYNHESVRRTTEYVTRKITKAAARIKMGLQKEEKFGNLDTKLDFGYAPDYVEAAWNILQLDYPDDFIICTGEVHSIQEFLDEAFSIVGLDPKDHIIFDEKFKRPGSTGILVGTTDKAKKAFGFEPKTRFKDIVKIMVEHDLEEAKKELILMSDSAVTLKTNKSR